MPHTSTVVNPEALHKSFVLLRERLNGHCEKHCPKDIWFYELADRTDWSVMEYNVACSAMDYKPGWKYICELCEKNFKWLSAAYPYGHCPCHRGCNPEELFLRLDEFIEELAENLPAKGAKKGAKK